MSKLANISPALENLCIVLGGLASLLFILGFFGLDATSFQKMTRFSQIMLLLLVISLLVFGTGLYLKLSRDYVTPDNIESHINEWIKHFALINRKIPIPDAEKGFYFVYSVSISSDIPQFKMLVARTKKLENYLTFRIVVEFSSKQQNDYNSLPSEMKERFITELLADLFKARVYTQELDIPNRFTVERTLPITQQLSESDFIQALTTINHDGWIGMTSINLCMERIKDIRRSNPQPSPPTPDTGASPH